MIDLNSWLGKGYSKRYENGEETHESKLARMEIFTAYMTGSIRCTNEYFKRIEVLKEKGVI